MDLDGLEGRLVILDKYYQGLISSAIKKADYKEAERLSWEAFSKNVKNKSYAKFCWGNCRFRRWLSCYSNHFIQASERYAAGMRSGNEMVQKIVSGEVKLAKDETIKLVGHSQGAAHAAGMAKALQDAYESGTINNKVEQIFYLAPHQPMSIETPAGIF